MVSTIIAVLFLSFLSSFQLAQAANIGLLPTELVLWIIKHLPNAHDRANLFETSDRMARIGALCLDHCESDFRLFADCICKKNYTNLKTVLFDQKVSYSVTILLIAASKTGRRDVVQDILNAGFINVDLKFGNEDALENGFYSKYFDIVRILIKMPKADLSRNDHEILREAIRHQLVEIVPDLLNLPIYKTNKLSIIQIISRMFVVAASIKGNEQLSEMLLNTGKVYIRKYGNKALRKSAKYGKVNMVKRLLLLKSVAPRACYGSRLAFELHDPETYDEELYDDVIKLKEPYSCIDHAAVYEHDEIVKLLLDVPTNNRYIAVNVAFAAALTCGSMNLVRYLFDFKEVDPSALNGRSLLSAITRGDFDIFRALMLKPRANPFTQRMLQVPLYRAARKGRYEIFHYLLDETNVDPSYADSFCLVQACMDDEVNAVERLLQDPRVDPTTMDNRPLLEAIENDCVASAICLLNDGRVDASLFREELLEWAQNLEDEDLFEVLEKLNIK